MLIQVPYLLNRYGQLLRPRNRVTNPTPVFSCGDLTVDNNLLSTSYLYRLAVFTQVLSALASKDDVVEKGG